MNGLLLLAAFFFAMAGVCGICGGLLYGTSHMFSMVGSAHLVNPKTASNFTRRLDAKLDSFRNSSAAKGKLFREMGVITFYVTGEARDGTGFAVPASGRHIRPKRRSSGPAPGSVYS